MPKINKDIIIPLSLFLVICLGFWYVPNIMFYLIISIILSLILNPLFNKLKTFKIAGKHISKGLAAGISLVAFYSVFYFIISFVVPLIIQQTEIVSSLKVNNLIEELKNYLQKMEDVYNRYLSDGSLTFNEYLKNKILEIVHITDLSDFINRLISLTGDLAIGLFSVTFITFFLLKDGELIYNFILSLFPSSKTSYYDSIMMEIKQLLNRYFVGLLAEVLLIMLLVSLGLSFFNISNAVLIGFIAGILNIVYYIGPLIGTLIGLILGLLAVYTDNPDANFLLETVKILSVFAVVQLLDNIVFQPIIYSNSIKAHPLEIFLVILIAGNVFGITGMVLSIPTYTVIRILIRNFLIKLKALESTPEHPG